VRNKLSEEDTYIYNEEHSIDRFSIYSVKGVKVIDRNRNSDMLLDIKDMFDSLDSKIEKVSNIENIYSVTVDSDVERIHILYDPLRIRILNSGKFKYPLLTLEGRKMRGDIEWI